MALTKCPECEKEISKKTPTCPNCGEPVYETAFTNFFLTPLLKQIFIGGFLIFLFVVIPDKVEDFEYRDIVFMIVLFPLLYIRNTKSIIGKILPVLFYVFMISTTTRLGIEFMGKLNLF